MVRPPERRLLTRLLINLVGGGVFIGLLVASHHLPQAATPLRMLAFLWFAGLIVLKFAAWAAVEREPARNPRPLRRCSG